MNKIKYTIQEMRNYLSKQSITICTDSKKKLALIKEGIEYIITENNHIIYRSESDSEALDKFKDFANWE